MASTIYMEQKETASEAAQGAAQEASPLPPQSEIATWTRRAWLSSNTATLLAAAYAPRLAPELGSHFLPFVSFSRRGLVPDAGQHSERIEPGPVEALAKQAVEAARAAGAQYADARLTRVV